MSKRDEILSQWYEDIDRANKCLNMPEFKDYAIKLKNGESASKDMIVKYVKTCDFSDTAKVINDLIQFRVMMLASEQLLSMVECDKLKEARVKPYEQR